MGLLDGGAEEPQSKVRRYVVTGLVFLILFALGLWWIFRFYPEKKVVTEFLDAVVAGNLEKAYKIWQPSTSYTYQTFLEDWSPSGFYGPVKSYQIEAMQKPKDGSGVIIVVGVSPAEKFPAPVDAAGQRRIKEVRLWVEFRDKSISFAP
jgi:hypothetical protein